MQAVKLQSDVEHATLKEHVMQCLHREHKEAVCCQRNRLMCGQTSKSMQEGRHEARTLKNI